MQGPMQWPIDWHNDNAREDEAAVPALVAETLVVADNVRISLTAVTNLVVVIPLANLEVNLRTTRIFIRAEPSNFAVPQPFFGRSC